VTKHPHHHESEKRPSENAAQARPDSESNTQAASPPKSQAETAPGKDDPLAKLQAELAAAKDRELRSRAELDNFRKRASRELDDQSRYANLSLLRDLLPVLDDVERAIQAADKNADAPALLEGFKMTAQQLADVLKRHQCIPIEALHLPFDPHVHHAILQQPSDEYPDNTVLMVTQTGYQLHDRVVRPSQVIVSTNK
jgi:molecular chaperone GrpE